MVSVGETVHAGIGGAWKQKNRGISWKKKGQIIFLFQEGCEGSQRHQPRVNMAKGQYSIGQTTEPSKKFLSKGGVPLKKKMGGGGGLKTADGRNQFKKNVYQKDEARQFLARDHESPVRCLKMGSSLFIGRERRGCRPDGQLEGSIMKRVGHGGNQMSSYERSDLGFEFAEETSFGGEKRRKGKV